MKEFVVMGVSGCGKSSVAMKLAEREGGYFLDADDFHPAENRDKMSAGIPLTDEDRWSWLDTLNKELKNHSTEGKSIFLACSALRQTYRDRLGEGLTNLHFIYLKGSRELIEQRLQQRQGHFMSPALLESQFDILEEPRDAIVVSVDDALSAIIDNIVEQLILIP